MFLLWPKGFRTRTLVGGSSFSEGTVKVRLYNIYSKLGVKNRTAWLCWHSLNLPVSFSSHRRVWIYIDINAPRPYPGRWKAAAIDRPSR